MRNAQLEPGERWQRIPPQSGVAFTLKAGETLVITDPEGEQVADLTALAEGDIDEWLLSGRTFAYNETIYLTSGHTPTPTAAVRCLRFCATTSVGTTFC